jgi:hypothetical protein
MHLSPMGFPIPDAATDPPDGAAQIEAVIARMEVLFGAGPQAWTPVLTSTGAAPSLGSGGGSGYWWRQGKLIIAEVRIAFGATGSVFGDGDYRVSLPPAAPSASLLAAGTLAGADPIGVGSIRDNGTPGSSRGGLTAQLASSTTFLLITSAGGALGAVNPITLQASDQIRAQLVYLTD